jgi:hypothetical protein
VASLAIGLFVYVAGIFALACFAVRKSTGERTLAAVALVILAYLALAVFVSGLDAGLLARLVNR